MLNLEPIFRDHLLSVRGQAFQKYGQYSMTETVLKEMSYNCFEKVPLDVELSVSEFRYDL